MCVSPKPVEGTGSGAGAQVEVYGWGSCMFGGSETMLTVRPQSQIPMCCEYEWICTVSMRMTEHKLTS